MASAFSFSIGLICDVIYIFIHGYSKLQLNTLLFILILFLGIVLHELVHGVMFSIYSQKKWKSVSFGFMWKYLMPYCSCDECLAYKPYVLSGIMPTIIVGFLPYVIALLLGSNALMQFSFYMILGGGGDMYIIYTIRKYKKAIFVDHPTKGGCVAFEEMDYEVN